MSDGETLYVRGMKSESDDSHMWNDTQLIKAYDKAMKSYRPADMAKRIAMATNAKTASTNEKAEYGKEKKWRVGAPCRAIYEDDGEYYEAYIVDILDNSECLVKFVGYGNEDVVKLKDLKPSHGNGARSEQVYNITTEPSWKEILRKDQESELNSASSDLNEDELPKSNLKETAHTFPRQPHQSGHKKSKKQKKSNKKRKSQSDPVPQDVFLHPSILDARFDAVGPFSIDMIGTAQLPPLPPLLPTGDVDDEQELLNNMLTAWYMSGYYAGLYQNRLKKKSKK